MKKKNLKFKLILIGVGILIFSLLGYGIYAKMRSNGVFGAPTKIDISSQTNLEATSPVVLTNDTLSLNLASSALEIDSTASISGTITFGSITGSTQCLHIDTNGIVSGTGSDCGAGGGGEVHGLLNTDWHTDVLLASVSQGSLIVGNSTPKWSELTVGASSSFISTDGTSTFWLDDPTISSASIDTFYSNYASISQDLTINGSLGSTNTRIIKGWFTDLESTNAIVGNLIPLSASSGTLISNFSNHVVASFGLGGTDSYNIAFAGPLSMGANTITMTGLFSGAHASLSDDFETNKGIITSLSATTLNFPDDSIAEADISFSTACAAGNHYYLNGTNLACEADDNTTYTASDPLTISGTTISIDTASAGDDGVLSAANWTTFNSKVGGSGVANYVPIWSGAALQTYDNSAEQEFYYDTTNHRLGLGDITPLYTLSINGTASISDDFYVGGNMLFADISLNTIFSSSSWSTMGNWDLDGVVSISDGFEGVGLADCDTAASSKLLWDATSKKFSCGTDQTAAGGLSAHMLLSDTHNDTLEASVSAGSLIVGNATPVWSELVIGASGSFLGVSNDTPVWRGTMGNLEVDGTASVSGITRLYGSTYEYSTLFLENMEEISNGTDGTVLIDTNDEIIVVQIGSAGADGILKLFSEQGASDYTTSLYPNIAMTSDASFYLPLDEPTATELLTMTSTGVMTFGGVASSSIHLAADKILEVDGTASISSTLWVGGTITGNLTGAVTGNASTATALAANGANCEANQYPLGVDANGAVENCTADANTTYTAGDMLTLTGTDFDIDDPFTVVGLNGTHVSASEDFTAVSGQITSLSATTLNFPNDSVQETDIDMDTTCGAGSFLYVNGNDFACAADDDVPEVGDFDNFSGGTNLTYDTGGNTLNVDDPFTVTTFTATHATVSEDFTTPSGQITSLSAGTIFGAGLVDCDVAGTSKVLWSDTGVFSCGTDSGTAYTFNNPLSVVGTAVSIDYASASGGGYLTFNNWEDFNGKLSSLSIDTFAELDAIVADAALIHNDLIDASSELLAIFDDETGTGNIVFSTNPTFTGASFSDDLTVGAGGLFSASVSATTINAGTLTEGGIAVLNNDEMDGSAELLNIFDDETGTGVIVFGTSPQFTTTMTTAGVFAINPGGALTIGDDGDTLYLNSSDWDIGTTGIMTGIGAITADGLFTGTHASMSGDLDVLGDLNITSVSAANFYGTLTGDLICTDCLNATEIEDIYLLDDGDVGTGVYDFGGATSFEIPNGTTLTLNAEGQVGIDTTGGQVRFRSNSTDYNLMATESFGFALSSTSYDLSPIRLKKFLEPITITSINCVLSTATSIVFQLSEGDANGANGAVVDAEMSITTTNVADDGSLTNSAIDSGDWVLASMSQSSGEADVLSCTVEYFFTNQ